MSGSVDDRVVALKFDNKQFESASAQSMSTLDRLKKSLDFSNANKSLGGLQKTAGSFNLGNIGTTIEGISTKFLAMGTIGVTALVQLTQQALQTGQQLASALTIDPVKAGFQEYTTNLNSIQTILANTKAAGTTLDDVNGTLAELNEYSDQTIYNFGQMAQSIGRFTAAGVKLAPATAAIKGMANTAALTGASAEQLNSAMYQMSQALSTGVIRLMDWNSLSNANMGTQNIQNALKVTARSFDDGGKSMDAAIKKAGNFRDSLQSGWLTSKIFTKTMKVMAGTMDEATGKYRAFTVEELRSKGYSKEAAKSLNELSQSAIESATQVKTIGQAFDIAKETAGSGWAKTWQVIFGDFDTAKKDMTALSNFINDLINKNAEERNKVLKEWAANGGRAAGIDALKNALKALMSVIDPIKQAWADVFPAATGKDLANTTKAIRDFFKMLILGPEQMAQIKDAFQGFFSILKIGQRIISGVFGFFKDLFGLLSSGGDDAAGGILEMASNIGKAITNFDKFLESSNAIPAFFDRLLRAVGPTVVKIRDFAKAVGAVLSSGIGKVVDYISNLGKAATTANEEGVSPLAEKWQAFVGFFAGIPELFSAVVDAIKGAFSSVGDGAPDITGSIMENLKKIDWVNVFKATIGVGFVSAVGLMIKGAWNFIQAFKTVVGIGKSAQDALDAVKDTLGAYQKSLKANSLFLLAAAILALAVAIKILSTIPVEDLLVSVGVMYIMFEMLDTSMKSFAKMGESKGLAKIPFIAAGLILIAGAMIIFALAVKLFSMMDLGELLKGIATIGVILRMIEVMSSDMAKNNANMLRAGAGILLLAIALNILAAAIFIYSKMEWETILKGLGAVVLIIGGISGAMNAMPKSGQLVKAAAGLLLIAVALNLLVIPIKMLGDMEFEKLFDTIVALGLMLAIMVLALNAMTGTMAGAAAMLIASAALIVFAFAIKTLSEVGFGSVILGILGIVIAMAAIAGAAFLLAPAAVPMAIFGAALLILGAGFFLLGVGALAFATAMSIIVTILSLGMPILEDTINNFIKIIPLLAKAFQTFLEEFANAFTEAIPEMVRAIETLIREILNAIERLIPEFQQTWSALIKAGLVTLASFYGDFIAAGLLFINKFLKGLADNLPGIIKSATDIVVALIKGIGDASYRITTAAGETMLDFIEGITAWLNTNQERIEQAGRDLAGAIVNGFTGGMAGQLGEALSAVGGFFGSLIERAEETLDSHSPSKVFIKLGKDVTDGFVIGILQGKQDMLDSFTAITEGIKQAKDDTVAEIKDLKSKIKDLENDDSLTKKQKKQLEAYKKQLKLAEAEKKRLDKAYKTITTETKTERARLAVLGGMYEKTKEKLEAATDAYKDAVKERDDYAKSIKEQYSELPAIEAETTLNDYFDSIRKATAANIKFKESLAKLKALGLDDTSYRKFMAEGVDAQPFLDQLLDAGGNAIAELANIDKSLTESASDLGDQASKALYQAGVDMAKGIMDGFQADMDKITLEMKKLGKAIADELKKELGIKSPSKVFMEIGKFTVEGLAVGIDKNAKVIDISSRRLGQTAVDALKESMAGLTDVVDSDIDLQPTIAPVLDLDSFRKDAAGINDILAPSKISPTTSTDVATDISGKTAAIQQALQEQALAATGTTLEFTQNINSPKAVSTAEVYRQTKNQLSVVKEALK